MIKILSKILTQSDELNRLQEAILPIINLISSKPIVNGEFIENISLTPSADNRIAHKLGKTPKYFLITDKNASADIWKANADSNYINLHTSANCIVSLYIGIS